MDTMRESPAPRPGQAAEKPSYQNDGDSPDMRKALLAGLIGGVVASAGYMLYQRLEDEQKEAIKHSVMSFVQDRIGDIRSQLKI